MQNHIQCQGKAPVTGAFGDRKREGIAGSSWTGAFGDRRREGKASQAPVRLVPLATGKGKGRHRRLQLDWCLWRQEKGGERKILCVSSAQSLGGFVPAGHLQRERKQKILFICN